MQVRGSINASTSLKTNNHIWLTWKMQFSAHPRWKKEELGTY